MIVQRGAISVGAVWVCLLVSAAGVAPSAEIVSVDLALVPASGDINTFDVTLTVTGRGLTREDDDTATVTGNILADLTVDYDPISHAAVATGLEFTGGVFELSPLDFTLNYGFLGTLAIDGRDMRGTMSTPLPPGTVAGGEFPAEEHVAIVNHGTMTVEGQGLVLGPLVPKTTFDLAEDPMPAAGQGTGTLTISAPDVNDGVGTYDVMMDLPMELDGEFTDEEKGFTGRGTGSATFRARGQFSRELPPPTLTWDGTDPGEWTSRHWLPGSVAPAEGQAMVANSGRVIVSSDLTALPAGSLTIASAAAGGTVDIGASGVLPVTGGVSVGAGGTLGNDGVLTADAVEITGGLLTNADTGLVGAARLTISSGVVNATGPVTITEKLTIGSEPVINVTNGLFSVTGADLLNDPVRELTLQGGQIAIDSGGLAIDMPGTDIIVVDDTTVDLGAAESATFDELVFGEGSILTIESDGPVNLFFGGISGEGELDGSVSLSDVTVTGVLSPGETGRVLTMERDASAHAVADYLAMLGALGYAAEADNVAMAWLDGDSYPVISSVPEPATLSLLLIGGLLAGVRRLRPRLSRDKGVIRV